MKKYFLKNKKNLLLYIILAVMIFGCVTVIYEMYALITSVIEANSYSKAYTTVLFAVGVLVALLVLMVLSVFVEKRVLCNIIGDLRTDLFSKIYRMRIDKFSKNETAYYTSMLVNDVNILDSSYFSKVLNLVSDIIQLLVMLFSITLIGWQYTLVVCGFSILSVLQPFVFKKRLARKGADISKDIEEYTATAKEYVFAYETIKSYQATSLFAKLFSKKVQELGRSNKSLWTTKMWNNILVMIAVYALKVGSQLFFAGSAILGFIPVATVALLFGLANNVGNPLVSILSYFEPINSTKDIRAKLEAFLDTTEDDEILTGKAVSKESFDISFKNVSFSYNGINIIIDQLSARFESGKKYALVGESGCGKSTLLKLLMGYYDNYNGEILIGQQELSSVKISSLRDEICYLTQSPYTFSGTVKDNITLNSQYPDSEIDEAVQKAELSELVMQLPNGLNENIESDSSNFSGGEKQRLAIARFLLKNHRILLMDESTSALDNLTAVEIENRLLQMKDLTVISIVHRFNQSIRLYDCIYYLENGKVAEAGTYDELMKRKGKFYSIVDSKGGIENA